MKDTDKSLHLNLKSDTYLASMHLGQLSVTQVDGGWRSVCQYYGFQKTLFCMQAIKRFSGASRYHW